MKNIDWTVKDNKLIVTVDLTQSFGVSSSGKSIMVGSTAGNKHIKDGIFMGVNVYKKNDNFTPKTETTEEE